MRDLILTTYDEFLIFMNIPKKLMPQINPIKNNNETTKDAIAYVNLDEIKFPVTNLYYNTELLDGAEKYMKSKLFHEFTHIMDFIQFHSKFKIEQLNSIMATYSEYHASQIELIRNIGIVCLSDVKDFEKLDIEKTYVSYKNSDHSITEEYIQPMSDASLIIDKPENYYSFSNIVEYYSNYKKFETKTMYYLGKQSVCFMLSKEMLPDITEKVYGDFYDFINAIKECIRNKELEKLPKVRNELWQKYVSKFHSIYYDDLPSVL